MTLPDPRRSLPAVDRLAGAVRSAAPDLPAWTSVAGARAALEAAREAARASSDVPALDALVEAATRSARSLAERHPRRVVNATGVVLHTNLGRAVLPEGAADAARVAATGFGDVELDLATGRRGDRTGALARKLALLAGSETALAVNNNAAALLLAVATLARGREVIVSRGELVEIGGSFRIPDILGAAGVELVEVGTTNRTHLEDYRRAIGPRTALLLKVHRSNFEQRGFVAEVALDALAALAHDYDLPVVDDLGSATLVDLRGRGLPDVTYAPERLRLGADVVCFSGDKLFGGPQAGLVFGAARWLEPMRRNPLARALRLDKATLAALDWTVDAMLGGRAEDALPTLRMLTEPEAEVAERARALAVRIEPLVARAALALAVVPSRAPVGGGSLPGVELPSWAVALRPHDGAASADEWAARLRAAAIPVVARVADGAVMLDARTLLDGDEAAIAHAVEAACRPHLR
jgi:L-seryl-tRNA(Ser) seleniumtransferase